MDGESSLGIGTWSGGVALVMTMGEEEVVAKLDCEEATRLARDLLHVVQVYEAQESAGVTGEGGDA